LENVTPITETAQLMTRQSTKPKAKWTIIPWIFAISTNHGPRHIPDSLTVGYTRGARQQEVYISGGCCHQWRIHPEDRNRLTVVSHRGQETFNVAIMGYMNSAAYVQRQLDNTSKLRDLHEFVRAYIDNIIISSDTWTILSVSSPVSESSTTS
jgi:hypothetical protein